MDLWEENYLKTVNRDIYVLRSLMYKASDQAGSLDNQLVIEISQFLDTKLNEHRKLTKSHSYTGKLKTNKLSEIKPLCKRKIALSC
ncbi:Spo0E family sporulation regulatory protein-aspartic acid phosphatase [Salibacterium salarium]|uniref:Spo0E family sporulation regulatory protein-aspartic acid phosphatase n=1 Tax=Salibacterium salarium TaxID=284579 RepID=UPI00163AEA62|nr:Spo0E family sporulation regulatory protein-aspartic acid phosphatase [Salibacterium salarium]